MQLSGIIQKIITGYTNTGMFGPYDNITREQLAVMLLRYDDTFVNNYHKTDKRADNQIPGWLQCQ